MKNVSLCKKVLLACGMIALSVACQPKPKAGQPADEFSQPSAPSQEQEYTKPDCGDCSKPCKPECKPCAPCEPKCKPECPAPRPPCDTCDLESEQQSEAVQAAAESESATQTESESVVSAETTPSVSVEESALSENSANP